MDLRRLEILAKVGSTQAIQEALKAGVGRSVLSGRVVEEECRSGLHSCLRLEDLRVTRSLHLATHKERRRSPLAEACRGSVESEAI